MGNIVLLREEVAAKRTARELAAYGHSAVILPTERIVALRKAVPREPFAAFAVTSARAVPAIAQAFPGDPRPVFAVGTRTAEALHEAGFADIHVAGGDASTTAELIGRLSEREHAVLYAAGRPRTGQLEIALEVLGIPFVIWEVYRTERVEQSPARICGAFAGADAVLLLSVGQAEAFLALAGHTDRPFRPGDFEILALSPRIAEVLPEAWRRVTRISSDKTVASLFAGTGAPSSQATRR